MDTIFALSTAPGKAGVAVIRLSGPDASRALCVLTPSIPPARVAGLRTLTDRKGQKLDEALVLFFEQDQSFTGEEIVEIQCHGSPAVVDAILSELASVKGLRIAEPGEFTQRALLNNRLDIAQVEGLADLLDAETEAQRRQAVRVFSGELGDLCESWRSDLIRAAALVEATIDFADEDVPVDVSPEVNEIIHRVVDDLSKEIQGVGIAERVRTGFEVAIVGAPNVGKSTLLNALAGREAAITSEVAGTTRDVIEVRMDLNGLPVTLLDTAGIRSTDDVVEALGIDRARKRASEADLRVVLLLDDHEPDIALEPDDIVLRAKADLSVAKRQGVSGLTGQGVSELIDDIRDVFQQRATSIGVTTRVRHKVAMERAVVSLSDAQNLISCGEAHADFAAEELRSAIRALDSMVGRIDIENILDEIFASFCLGK